ncbi:DUF805 domain-containing protein [Apilactobacillus kunkeei]|uniref:DUF805 domain-containing protein n=1 Tax=Apilactobacillus kunkeei TaxID=148814 RepID=UPI0023575FA1|nr:DUF805 domain-containing protein [Apilactobacillus kunkeei]
MLKKNNTSFTDALKSYFKHLYTIAGCSSRKEYWLGYLWMMIFSASVFSVWLMSYFSLYEFASGVKVLKCIGFIFAFSMYFISISMIFSMCRRLHDSNISGWFLLLLLIPILGWIVIFVLLCQPSKEEGKRRYGSEQPSTAVNHIIGWILVFIFGLLAGMHEMNTLQFNYEEVVYQNQLDRELQKEKEEEKESQEENDDDSYDDSGDNYYHNDYDYSNRYDDDY